MEKESDEEGNVTKRVERQGLGDERQGLGDRWQGFRMGDRV